MSQCSVVNLNKYCNVYCGPERCDCAASLRTTLIGGVVCETNATHQEHIEEVFKKIMEDHRKQVQEKDKEHVYDRAMEILEGERRKSDAA